MQTESLPLPSFEKKILTLNFSREELQRRLQALEKPIVFTNGVFDILHRGHVTYLAQAKTFGKSLIVGVNADESVKLLGKGDDRPINLQDDRMALLASLASVDLVICFKEKTPVELLCHIRPDVYVKGGDYHVETLPETAMIKTWGGQAFAIPFLFQRSTTKLLQKIRV